MLKRRLDTNIAHDLSRTQFLPVGHPDTDRAVALEKNALDFRIDDNRTPSAFDGWKKAFGDPSRSADRIRSPIEVVGRDDRVNAEAALLRRQPIVAPLRREHGPQLRARPEVVQHTGRRPARERQERRAECSAQAGVTESAAASSLRRRAASTADTAG